LHGILETSPNRQVKTPALPSGEPSDAELLRRISGSDHHALDTLYRRYVPRVSRFAQRMLSSPEAIEEVVNDVMYVVWRKAPTFSGSGQASTWIFGIAYRTCLKALGNRTTDEHLPLADAEDLIPGLLDSGMETLELNDWVARLFEQLPPEQRAVLELTYHQELKYSEIAEILGCPENTVKTRMFHARRKIRALMPDVSGDEPAPIEGTP
jgi:RNA polymerase sigma-70 factor (ECF subfamily)